MNFQRKIMEKTGSRISLMKLSNSHKSTFKQLEKDMKSYNEKIDMIEARNKLKNIDKVVSKKKKEIRIHYY